MFRILFFSSYIHFACIMAKETRAQLSNKSLMLRRNLTHICRVKCLDRSISNRKGAFLVFIGTMLSRNSCLL